MKDTAPQEPSDASDAPLQASETELTDLARVAALVCGTRHAAIAVVAEESVELRGRVGWRVRTVPRAGQGCLETLLHPHVRFIPDTAVEARPCPLLSQFAELRFYAGAPLRTSGGGVAGALVVMDPEPRTLDEEQQSALMTLARHAARLLEAEPACAASGGEGGTSALQERALESERRFQRIARATNDAVWDWDLQSNEIWWGDGMRTLFGHSPDEGRNLDWWYAHIHPDDRIRVARSIEAFIRSGYRLWTEEYRFRRKDGQYAYVIDRAYLAHDEAGRPARMFGGILDISKRKRAEAALRESEARLRMLLLQMPSVSWTTDRELRLTAMVGDTARAIWDPQQLVGKTLGEIAAEHGQDSQAEHEHRRALEGEAAEYEYTYPPDGRTFAVRVEPLRNAEGAIEGSIGLAVDITQRKRAEEDLRRYSEELEALVQERTQRLLELEGLRREEDKLAAAGRVAARVAHEINNPLAGIKNAFLLLKDAIPADHRYARYVPRIEQEIDRIAAIVRQMLDLYQPDASEPREFPVESILHDVRAALEPAARRRNVLLRLETQGCAGVRVPAGAFRQIVYNLVQNAIDVSPEGGAVEIELSARDGVLTCRVSDEGSGMSPEVRRHVFEPFFTTKAGRPGTGLGLGLPVSRSLAEGLGGKLEFEEEDRPGMTFRLTLPLRQEPRNQEEGRGTEHG